MAAKPKKKVVKTKLSLQGYADWLLRVALAGVFLYHGPVLFPMAGNMAQMMHMPVIIVYVLATAEALAGVAILLGKLTNKIEWLTKTAGAIIAVVMAGAIAVHWGQWSFIPSTSHPMGGIEFQFTLLCLGLYFLIKGNKA